MTLNLKNMGLVAMRWLLGGVFVFSGLVKCVDPVGTSIFVEKYLATYSLDSLTHLSLPIAVALSSVEVLVGILLIIGLLRRRVAIATTAIIAAFTVVTLLSATILPIGDCGCFGDAVKLTPWQTFAKNVVLLVLSILLWRHSKEDRVVWLRTTVVVIAVLALPIGINLYSLRYLPLVDFLPYKVGVELRKEVVREREAADVKSVLIFRNSTTGEIVEFSAEDTSCWTNPDIEYVDARVESVASEGDKYSDFCVYNRDSEDVTRELLEKSGRVAWLCINDALKLEGTRLSYVERLFDAYPADAIVVLTSTDRAFVAKRLGSEVYTIDAMTLRSIMRADVGVVVLNDGVVEYKSDIRDI
jgi:uncharacterized membrane protein YphA (DoxX/SURF4 family)